MNIIIILLVDLKKEGMEDTVFIMKAKTPMWNALLKKNMFD